MNRICSAGVLYLCLVGELIDEEIELHQVNTYQNAFDFYIRSKEILENQWDVSVFAIIGIKDKVEKIAGGIEGQIKDNFQRLVKGEERIKKDMELLDQQGEIFGKLIQEYIFEDDILKIPRKCIKENEAWVMYCFWGGEDEEDDSYLLIDDVLEIWCSCEQPLVFGKQIMIRSFQMADLRSRKILDVYPDGGGCEWNVILEGGLKLELGSDVSYMRKRVGVRDNGNFSIGDVDSILNNPIYSYGKWLYPTEIYEEWHKVFLYTTALYKKQWEIEEFQRIYEAFLVFLEENICDVMSVEDRIIDKDRYYGALMNNLKEIQKYLAGEDSPVISRDLWLLLNSRYVYFPYICDLIDEFQIEDTLERKVEFKSQKLEKLLQLCEIEDSYQKGVKWEEVAEYFFENIDGLKISGRRVKTLAQEIDFSIVNTSLEQKLWELGAYILVECKNWKNKVGIEVIRELSHISELKGNKTTVLFTVNGITQKAEAEILRLAVNRKYIIHITKTELQNLIDKQQCYELLIKKWDELIKKAEKELFI